MDLAARAEKGYKASHLTCLQLNLTKIMIQSPLLSADKKQALTTADFSLLHCYTLQHPALPFLPPLLLMTQSLVGQLLTWHSVNNLGSQTT